MVQTLNEVISAKNRSFKLQFLATKSANGHRQLLSSEVKLTNPVKPYYWPKTRKDSRRYDETSSKWSKTDDRVRRYQQEELN